MHQTRRQRKVPTADVSFSGQPCCSSLFILLRYKIQMFKSPQPVQKLQQYNFSTHMELGPIPMFLYGEFDRHRNKITLNY